MPVSEVLYISTLREAQGPLAQLDRASGYGPEGQGFESLTACQKQQLSSLMKAAVSFYLAVRNSNPERVGALRKYASGIFLAPMGAADSCKPARFCIAKA